MLSWDYCFLSSKQKADDPEAEKDGQSPVLVMWDSKGKGLHAHILPHKGVDYPDLEKVVKLVVGNLDRLGYKRVAFRSDNESASTSFLRVLRQQ